MRITSRDREGAVPSIGEDRSLTVAARRCSRIVHLDLVPLLLILLCSCTTTPRSAAPAKIAEFQGEYRFLSNFWPATVEFEGIMYPTAEHAYQSAKTLDMNERKRIAELPTPGEAKRAGRALALRPDWEQVKLGVMEECVRYKFTHHAELSQKLLATADAHLEEGNTWGDTFWGTVHGAGQNHLGRILMRVRGELWRSNTSYPTP
jgi:ribA/ribD-fused uncharacterized protein